jgi:hypothetical protein
VGGGWVSAIKDITDNEIICLPPDQLTANQVRAGAPNGVSDREPSSSPEDELYGLHTVDVVVRAGTLHTMLAGTLAYRFPEKQTITPDNSTMIISVSVVLSVVFVVLVATVIGKCSCSIICVFIYSFIYVSF